MGKEGYLDIKLEEEVTSLSEVVILSRKRGEVNNTLKKLLKTLKLLC